MTFSTSAKPNDSLGQLKQLKECLFETNVELNSVTYTPNKQQKQSCGSVFFQGKVKMVPLDL